MPGSPPPHEVRAVLYCCVRSSTVTYAVSTRSPANLVGQKHTHLSMRYTTKHKLRQDQRLLSFTKMPELECAPVDHNPSHRPLVTQTGKWASTARLSMQITPASQREPPRDGVSNVDAHYSKDRPRNLEKLEASSALKKEQKEATHHKLNARIRDFARVTNRYSNNSGHAAVLMSHRVLHRY